MRGSVGNRVIGSSDDRVIDRLVIGDWQLVIGDLRFTIGDFRGCNFDFPVSTFELTIGFMFSRRDCR